MKLSSYELEIKKSKFIGILYIINNEDDAKKIIDNIKNNNRKANHFPYAYIINQNARKSDDKEPHNSAGIQIYNQLVYNNLSSHLLVIIRYYGGTKLGAGNLLRAYATCAKETIKNI